MKEIKLKAFSLNCRGIEFESERIGDRDVEAFHGQCELPFDLSETTRLEWHYTSENSPDTSFEFLKSVNKNLEHFEFIGSSKLSNWKNFAERFQNLKFLKISGDYQLPKFVGTTKENRCHVSPFTDESLNQIVAVGLPNLESLSLRLTCLGERIDYHPHRWRQIGNDDVPYRVEYYRVWDMQPLVKFQNLKFLEVGSGVNNKYDISCLPQLPNLKHLVLRSVFILPDVCVRNCN